MRYEIWSDGSTRRWHVEDTLTDSTVDGIFDHEGDTQQVADKLNQKELDAQESLAIADLAIQDWERQGDSVQELAEAHLQAEGERYMKHLFDAKYGV